MKDRINDGLLNHYISEPTIVPSADHYRTLTDYMEQVKQAKNRAKVCHNERLLDLIAMRLRLEDSDALPFDFITAHQIDKERAVVFLVHGGEAQTIEDDGNLFPSDALITKLRLLME